MSLWKGGIPWKFARFALNLHSFWPFMCMDIYYLCFSSFRHSYFCFSGDELCMWPFLIRLPLWQPHSVVTVWRRKRLLAGDLVRRRRVLSWDLICAASCCAWCVKPQSWKTLWCVWCWLAWLVSYRSLPMTAWILWINSSSVPLACTMKVTAPFHSCWWFSCPDSCFSKWRNTGSLGWCWPVYIVCSCSVFYPCLCKTLCVHT